MLFTAEECVVCLDHSSTAIFSPCRHQCVCRDCSALIQRQKMPCPMCRSAIEAVTTEGDHIAPLRRELDRFAEEREEYIKQLHRPCAKNAGFVGKGKLARCVASAMGDELERRRAENAGTERMTSKSVEFARDEEENLLRVTYKVGRRLIHETAPLIDDWTQIKQDFEEALQEEDVEKPSTPVEVAAFWTDAYWLCRYHKKPVDELLPSAGREGRAKRQRTTA